MRTFLRVCFATAAAVSAGYIWNVGQTGLAQTNRNLCELWESLRVIVPLLPEYKSCEFQSGLVYITLACAALALLWFLVEIGLWIRRPTKKELAPGIGEPSNTPLNPAIEIAYGEDEPFEKLTAATLSRLDRLLLLELKNPFPDKAITGCKLEVITIEPFMGVRRPFVLRENFSLAGGDHVFIPFVSYGESRSADRTPITDTAIALLSPQGENPHFLAALPHDVESVITLRATAMQTSVCEEKVVVWVGAGTRLRIKKFEGSTDNLFIPLEDAAEEIYGLTRLSVLGEAAERDNPNGPLAWFAYYYHVKDISVFGNVRNSARIEPVLFRHTDIMIENGKLIAKEKYGDLIWENLKVRNADQARMRQIALDHVRALTDG